MWASTLILQTGTQHCPVVILRDGAETSVRTKQTAVKTAEMIFLTVQFAPKCNTVCQFELSCHQPKCKTGTAVKWDSGSVGISPPVLWVRAWLWCRSGWKEVHVRVHIWPRMTYLFVLLSNSQKVRLKFRLGLLLAEGKQGFIVFSLTTQGSRRARPLSV